MDGQDLRRKFEKAIRTNAAIGKNELLKKLRGETSKIHEKMKSANNLANGN